MDGNWGSWGDYWLWLLWLCIFTIWAAHNACIAALAGINIEVIPSPIRTVASGTEMTFRNILGYACGPMLPGFVMDLINGSQSAKLRIGLGVVLAANVGSIFIIHRAVKSAATEL